MFIQYGHEACIYSLFQNLNEDKQIVFKDVLYRFYIMQHALYIDIINNKTHEIEKTMMVVQNVKVSYDIHVQNRNRIHIVVSTKKYDIYYIFFDGEKFNREIIYRYNSDIGIPSNPVVRLYNSCVHITVLFICMDEKKAWLLCSYTKKNAVWESYTIDKGEGVCYTQHDMRNNSHNMYLVYKYYDDNKGYNLKYARYDLNKMRWCRPRVIYNNNTDKFIPKIFINNDNLIFFLWLEIDEGIFVCTANGFNDLDYCRLEITGFLDSIVIFNNNDHIYAISSDKRLLNYDLCCDKNVSDDVMFINKGSESELDNSIILISDMKREYDDRIRNMKSELAQLNNKHLKEIEALRNENMTLRKKLESQDYKQILHLDEETKNIKDENIEIKVQNGNKKMRETHLKILDIIKNIYHNILSGLTVMINKIKLANRKKKQPKEKC